MSEIADEAEAKVNDFGDGLERGSHLLQMIAERVLAEVSRVGDGLNERSREMTEIAAQASARKTVAPTQVLH